MRSKIITGLSALVLVILIQGCSINAKIKRADKKYDIGEYYNAGNMYKNIYTRLTYNDKVRRAKVSFREAECFRLTNQTRAEQCYQNAIKNNYPDSIVFLRYAQTLLKNGKFDDAVKNYKIYLKKDTGSVVAKNGIIAAQKMVEWKAKPSKYAVRKAEEFNARRSGSFSPAFMGSDADAFAFTSSRSYNKNIIQKTSAITGIPYNKIFQSKKNAAGKWEAPILIEIINTLDDNGVCSFTADGKKVFFTRSMFMAEGEKGTEIYTSSRAGGTWSDPQKVKVFKDTTVSVAHPAISPDGSTLYFVSDGKGGIGGKDIWKATVENNECKYIENLGPQINTPGDEMFPTVKADGSLYFSSDGHPGLGGLDIFKATQNKKGDWTVENVGLPANSPADDFGMVFAGTSEKGFFSSNRGDTKGYDGIWAFEIPEITYTLEGKVTDEKGNPVPDASVRMVADNGVNAKVLTKKDGTYRIKLEKGMDCVLMASATGYLNKKNTIKTTEETASKVYHLDFQLASVYKPVQIEDIFYEFGKWDLTPASEKGLQTLVKLLKDNPNITIQIASHTDFVGSNAANLILSEKRAKSVVDYLINAGIAADRLTSVGYGEEKPETVSAELAKKHKFLKVNDLLDEAYVTKLTPEQQEIVNQINRRTEFKVVKTTYKLY